MKNLQLILLFVFVFSGFASAQNPTLAKLKYEAAEELFLEEKFKECLAKLDEAVAAFGKTNPPIAYLKIRAYEKANEKVLNQDGSMFSERKFEHIVHLSNAIKLFLKNYGEMQSVEDRTRELLKMQDKYETFFSLLEAPPYKEVMAWFLAAQKGDTKAMLNYATFLKEKSFSTEALSWFFKAAEKGNVEAMARIAEYWRSLRYDWSEVEGYDKERVRARAVKFIKQAASEQHPMALLNYGRVLVEGNDEELAFLGLKKDIPAGLELMKKSVASGYKEAFWRLAEVYYFGHGGVEKNYSAALDLYKKGPFDVGMAQIYAKGGYGVQQDLKKALEHIEKVPSTISTYSLVGDWHRDGGIGLEKNYAIAMKNYEAAIKLVEKSDNEFYKGRKDVYLMKTAKLFFEGGYGIRQDYQRAFNIAFAIYEKKTTDTDVKNEAAFIVGEITFEKLVKLSKQYSKEERVALAASMVQCFEDAVKGKDKNTTHTAMLRLAEIYEKGIIVGKQKKLAEEWRKKADAHLAKHQLQAKTSG